MGREGWRRRWFRALVAAGVLLVAAPSGMAATRSFDLGGGPSRQLAGNLAGDGAGSVVAGGFDLDGDGLDDVAVGAPDADPLARADAGEVYVVFGSTSRAPLDLSTVGAAGAGVRIVGASAGDQIGAALGRSVAGAGDVNGDGFDDLLVASYQANTSVGEVAVVFGSAAPGDLDLNGGLGARGIVISGAGGVDSAGFAVDGAGDVDGDGFDDLLISAPRATAAGRAAAGVVYLVFGSASPTSLTLGDLATAGTGFRILGAGASDYLGRSVAGAGDLNGDGYDDMVMSAVPDPAAGHVYIAYGDARANLGDVDLATPGSAIRFDGGSVPTNAYAGWSVDGAGDVDGDGYDDVIVGARKQAFGGLTDSGGAFVIFGGTAMTGGALDGLSATGRGSSIAGAYAGADTGYAVAGVGDANGDGLADLAIGAPFADPGTPARTDAGAVYLVRGASAFADLELGDLPAAMGFEAIGALRDLVGSVAGAGDVDGDGFADAIVGAPGADPDGRGEAGAAFVVYGFGPSSVAYGSGIDATAGVAITPLTPTASGTGVATFSVDPALPSGLAIDTTSGVIAGTPTGAVDATYTVSMTDLAGIASTQVRIAVRVAPGPTPPVVKPDNRFTILKRKRAGRYVLVTRIRVPGPGILTQSTLRTRIVRRGSGKRKRLVTACRVRKRPARAGIVTLRCRVNAPARRLLSKRRIRFTVRYAFTPVGGDRSQRTRKFTLRKVTPPRRAPRAG